MSELAMWPCHTSVEMSRSVIESFFIPAEHTFAIVLKETQEAIGCIGLVPRGGEHHPTGNNEREAGYWVGMPYWNMGITTEALAALIEYCRAHLRLDSLIITTDLRNIASRRVAEKAGFSFISYIDVEDIPSTLYRLSFK